MNTKVIKPETLYLPGGERGVILLHAYTGSPNDVRQLGRCLNQENYSVLMPLLSGHGTDDAENILASGPIDWLTDVIHSLNEMEAKGFDQIAIFGLSLGGVLALNTVANRSDLIIGGGSFCSPVVPTLKSTIIPSFIQYGASLLKHKQLAPEEEEKSLARIEAGVKRQLSEIQELSEDVYDQLGEITQPLFVAQAGQDELIDAQQVFKMTSQLIQSPFQLNWYPKSGHVITVGTERHKLQGDVLAFLNKLNWTEK